MVRLNQSYSRKTRERKQGVAPARRQTRLWLDPGAFCHGWRSGTALGERSPATLRRSGQAVGVLAQISLRRSSASRTRSMPRKPVS
jgi:hypothetical protein